MTPYRFSPAASASRDALTALAVDGTVLATTKAASRLFGQTPSSASTTNVFDGVHVDDQKILHDLLQGTGAEPIELRVSHVDGSWRRVEVARSDVDGHDTNDVTLVVIRDITEPDVVDGDGERERDSLTRLVRRPSFVNHVRRAFALATRQRWGTAVYAVNIDGFHKVNEEFGYGAGDAVLVAIAARLAQTVREHDTKSFSDESVTRVGGDQFFVLCENVPDPLAANGIARRLVDELSAPLELGDHTLRLTVSVGIAFTVDKAEPQQFILDAEAALRRAQQLGGSRHHFFDAELHEAMERAEAQVEALRRALVNDEFRLVFQPKISLGTDRIVGVEALLRWDDPELGLISPADFIPAAEASGLVVPIGTWVFGEACRQAAIWRNEYPRSTLTVSINVSARQFKAGLADIVRAALDEAGVEPSTICVEMTETTVMDDIETTVVTLEELKEMGLTVSIDDFGTGYSSLEYLHRMPIDEVKIDKSFIHGLGVNNEQSAIVASVISLAHAMGRDVVAEGVETNDQLERLRSLGCDLAQGYLIARPMPAGEIGPLIAADAAGERMLIDDRNDDASPIAVSETVLIVDDVADIRQLAMMSLTASGFTVEEAGSGAAALALAKSLRPDCVLLDLNMPDMSGLEVCKALRAEPENGASTIVMLTASADAADKAEAFLVGADDYIVKPFSPRDLVSRVRAAMKRRRETVSSVGRQIDVVLLDMLKVARDQTPEVTTLAGAEKLSTRQLEVLGRLLAGERVPAIATALFLSPSTVRNHLSVIFQRLGVHSQQELIQLLRSK
jgi:diguanylate cyclase (GGDEF)-like protein/PAS domain S-box-containing protein